MYKVPLVLHQYLHNEIYIYIFADQKKKKKKAMAYVLGVQRNSVVYAYRDDF